MNFEKKMKQLYKHVKSGNLTEEIGDEIADIIDNIGELGDDVKSKYSSMVKDMKHALKKMKK